MNEVIEKIYQTLVDIKAKNITTLDTSSLTDQHDYIIIATATSTRHAKSIATHLYKQRKKCNKKIIPMEGLRAGEWILVDFGNIVAHIMLNETRQYYDLDALWGNVTKGTK